MTKAEQSYLANLLRRLVYLAGYAVEEDGAGIADVTEAEQVIKEMEDGKWTLPNV